MGMNTTTGSILRRIPVDECPCFIPDENDNCIDCGKHIDLSDEALGELPNLGDIVGICRLIESSAISFARVIRDNTDPKDSSLTRLRIVSNRMVRLSHETMFQTQMETAYKKAKALGYRGTFGRWGELVEERMTTPASIPAR